MSDIPLSDSDETIPTILEDETDTSSTSNSNDGLASSSIITIIAIGVSGILCLFGLMLLVNYLMKATGSKLQYDDYDKKVDYRTLINEDVSATVV